MMKSSIRLFVLLLATLLLSACEFSLAADITPPPGYQPEPEIVSTPKATTGPQYPLLPPNPAEGKIIYDENCAACHGTSGMGDGPQVAQLPNEVPALGSPEVARQASPEKWYGIITQGNMERFMPPFSSLTDRQRWDVLAYVLSLSVPENSLAQGEELYQANCTECHAPDGTPVNAGMPDFTNQESMAGKATQDFYQMITDGSGNGMPSFTDRLDEEQRWTLAHYLRTFTFAMEAGASLQLTPSTTLTDTQVLTATTQISSTEGLGAVSGLVINASGGELPAGITVTLHAFDGMQVVLTSTTTASEAGAYLFSNIEIVPERFYLTTVDYQEITYGSEVVGFEEGQMDLVLPLQIYESTQDASVLSVDRLHFFFEMSGENIMRVVELYIISNPSSKTVIPATQGAAVVNFTLPQGASNLEFQDGDIGERYILTDAGFADTTPVRPGIGSYQVMFSYELPYKNKVELVRIADMVTNAVVILVPEDGIKIKGDRIQDAGVRDVQGSPYHLYNGNSFQVGDEIRLTISNNVSLVPTGSGSNLLVGLAALGLVMIGAGIWLYRRNQAGTAVEPQESSPVEETYGSETPESIMDAILALDDLHQAGQLPEDAYIQRRDELRARLKELMGKKE